MDSHHASMGRRKLEEIRQKNRRPAEGSTKEQESSLVKQEHLERENEALKKRLEECVIQIQGLTVQLQEASNDARLVTELRQSIKTLSIERDAAVIAKEDLLTQLRVARRRLQEAEEEQYKAEEDAASLRAELQHLRHVEASTRSPTPAVGRHELVEQEMMSMRTELQSRLLQLQQEQEKLANEEQRAAKLAAEKEELELALAQSKAIAARAGDSSANRWRSKVDSGKYEQHLRELASMVERLESGRQKLLTEIDGQSLEIEKLFMENDALLKGLEETRELAAQWEQQVNESMKHNKELGRMLSELSASQPGSNPAPPQAESDIAKLKVDLLRAIAQRDELSLRVSQLALELSSSRQSMNSISRQYKPVLANIHSRLLQVKQIPLPLVLA